MSAAAPSALRGAAFVAALVAALAALAPSPVAATEPTTLDRAANCRRAADAACALEYADRALAETPGVPAPEAATPSAPGSDEGPAAREARPPSTAAPAGEESAVGTDRPWTASLGAGVGLLLGDAASRYGPGIELAIDVSRALGDSGFALWVHGAVALFQLDDDLPIEPGAARGLTSLVGAAGAAWSIPVHEEVALVFAAGVGWGTFGLGGLDGDSGFAAQASAGARWQVEDRLALRLDVTPRVIFSRGPARVAGHTAIVLRGEARF